MVTFDVLGHRGMLGSVVTRRWAQLGASRSATAEFVINCIRPDDPIVSERLAETRRLIQPSTDAIAEFSDYAVGKRLLERLPAVTIRAGIVDVGRQPPVAFTNWACNPVTPLEWAEYAYELREVPGVHPLGREAVSRYDVARLVAQVWDLQRPIEARAPVELGRVQPSTVSLPPLEFALRRYRDWLRA